MRSRHAGADRVLVVMAHRFCAAIGLLLLLMGEAVAQSGRSATDGSTPLGLAPGAPAGSYALSGFDNINPYNGNLNFSLPLLHVGGRGGAQHTITLPIEIHWRTIRSGIHVPFTFFPTADGWASSKPGYSAGFMVARLTGVNDLLSCESVTNALTRLTFTAADGTEYEFHDVSYNGVARNNFFAGTAGVDCHLDVNQSGSGTTNRGRVFVTADGSSATFVSDTDIYDFCVDCEPPDYGGIGITELRPTGNLMMRDGTLYRIVQGDVAFIRDRNGNQINFTFGAFGVTRITDSLNREVNINYFQDGQGNPLRDEITYRGFDRTLRTVTVNYGLLDTAFRTGFGKKKLGGSDGLFPELNGASQFTDFNPFVFTSVTLPNNQSYQFYYDSYGELARVILPTGGAFEYDYDCGLVGGASSGVVTQCGNKEVYRRVVEKRIYVDGQGLAGGGTLEGKMTFSRPEDSGGGNAGVVDIYSRNASDMVMARSSHFFYGSTSGSWCREPTDYSKWKDGKEWKTSIYDSAGTTELQRMVHTLQQPVSGNNWPLTQAETSDNARPNDPQITDTTTTLYATVAGESNQVAYQSFAFDRFINKTDAYEYDFGPGAYGALIRRSHTDYLTTNNGANYATDTAIHIRSLPALQWVSSDAAGNSKKSQSLFEYDNYNQITQDNFHHSLSPCPDITGLDSAYTTTYYTRGNVTATTHYLLDTNGSITGSISGYAHYDIAGNAVEVVDPRSTSNNLIVTTFDFSDRYGTPDTEAQSNTRPVEVPSGFQTYALATKVTSAAPFNQIAYTQYDYYLGKAVNTEDPNGLINKNDFRDDNSNVDPLDRPRQIVRAAGAGAQSSLKNRTFITYDDTNRIVTTEGDLSVYNDKAVKSDVVYDRLGRTVETRQYEPGGGIIHTVQQYDGMGRVSRTYNPYRTTGDPTYGYSDTIYDGLGRLLTVTTSDGAVVTTGYSANATTVTDQATKKRRSITDGLGRLIRVDEPDSTGSLGTVAAPTQPTYYVYDVLDDLKTVTQGSQTSRNFSYDSLKRLTDATNPESGHVQYTYDNNGNLQTKTDARGITTTYTYDALNRVTKRAYTGDPQNTPEVDYYYDNQTLPTNKPPNFTPTLSIGRLTAVCYGGLTSSAGSYSSYDWLGRVTSGYQQTDSQNYGFGYGYNLAGGMTSETYPSGRVVATEYDSAGRIAGVKNQATGAYWAGATPTDAVNRIQYTAHGAVSVMKLGNLRWEHTNYNSRLEPEQIGLGTSSTDSSILRLDYTYGSTNNNGNLQTQRIVAGSFDVTQNYTYDELNRLKTANENSGANWSQTYGYDRWGNRWVSASLLYTLNPLTPTSGGAFNTANNRLVAPSVYDPAGNLTADSQGRSFEYDGENRQTKFNTSAGLYFYDGDGRRVKKTDINGTTVFVYNVGGQLIAEYHSDPVPPGAGGGGTSYLTSDHLGSTRVVTRSDGTVKARYDYLPFGEELGSGIGGRTVAMGYSAADSTQQKFTQKERDIESGLDYFLARYYSSAQGRFTSIDPLSGKEEVPQSWNRYTYTLNNSLKFLDPDGLEWRRHNDTGGIKWYNENDDRANTTEWTQLTYRINDTQQVSLNPYGPGSGSPDVYQYLSINEANSSYYKNGWEIKDTVTDPGPLATGSVQTDWNATFAIGGLLNAGRIGLGAAIDSLGSSFSRTAAAKKP